MATYLVKGRVVIHFDVTIDAADEDTAQARVEEMTDHELLGWSDEGASYLDIEDCQVKP